MHMQLMMRRKWNSVWMGIFVWAACTNNEAPVNLPERSGKEALFFIIAGNSSLRNEANEKVKSILQMENCPEDIFVLKDTSSPEGSIFIHKNKENAIDTLMAVYDESLQSVIKKATLLISQYRPQNISLLVFSHATGWYPPETEPTRSAIIDNYSELSLEDLYHAIDALHYKSIVFESCNMGGVECLYQFHDLCDYFAASSTEMLSPGFGPLYKRGIESLAGERELVSFVQQYGDYVKQLPQPYSSCALSACRTAGAKDLFNVLKKINRKGEMKVDIEKVQGLHRMGETEVFYDLESYFENCNLPMDLQQELHQALNKCIIYKNSTPFFMLEYRGFPIKTYCGLSIFDFLTPSPFTPVYKKTGFGAFLFDW